MIWFQSTPAIDRNRMGEQNKYFVELVQESWLQLLGILHLYASSVEAACSINDQKSEFMK